MGWYIFLGIFILIILAIFIPIKIKIKYAAISNTGNNEGEELKYENFIQIYLYGFIKIFKISLNKKDKNDKTANTQISTEDSSTEEADKVVDTVYNVFIKIIEYLKVLQVLLNKEDIKKINNSIKFKKLDLNLGINFKDLILNAYIVTFITSIISIYIGSNINRFNRKKLMYNVYVSNKIIDLNLDCIIKFKLANNIGIMIKIINELRKVEDKNVRTTSNRKFDDDSHDIYRKYDRC